MPQGYHTFKWTQFREEVNDSSLPFKPDCCTIFSSVQ